ncbi:MAG: NADH:flavin oxidoreductase [Candidatus Omnitrophica bacterium]|nr:NADH:flavin oxidoreductase [Candidatus Omnitrophota bacterium]
MSEPYPRISKFKTSADLKGRLKELGLDLPCDDRIETAPESPLAQPLEWNNHKIGNRWAIHPMEGWDGTEDGRPTDYTRRRWTHFGLSGAKLIWGGEAVAVRHDGRANPNQLLINEPNLFDLETLREDLVLAHQESIGETDDLFVGLQLTHSGRFSRPNEKMKPEPRVLYHHPILDKRVQIKNDDPVFTDGEIDALIEDFVIAAKRAWKIGFHFVDIKHCHGYLGHEFLTAFDREGKYGGSFENRTRFLDEVVKGIQAEAPGLEIGVRLSSFDILPYRPDPETSSESKLGIGVPEECDGEYRCHFGDDPLVGGAGALDSAIQFVRFLLERDIRLVNITCGSPYYNPHIQRPAYFPPSDGYQPPEDPLIGVVRLLTAAKIVKEACPEAIVVGTGFTYLQDFIPRVAQALVREGWMDFAGVGRLVLSYPELPHDSLTTGKLKRKKICRTFSDCTTGPRKGMISGCFPLDPFYKNSDLGDQFRKLKMG